MVVLHNFLKNLPVINCCEIFKIAISMGFHMGYPDQFAGGNLLEIIPGHILSTLIFRFFLT